MEIKAYSFNIDAKYKAGVVGESKSGLNATLTQPSIRVQSGGGDFQTQYQNVFEKYRLPGVTSDEIVRSWNSSQMQFWQNQVNFAVWCATAGCGVSAQDHLAAQDPMVRSLYHFHVYYQVRRILDELQAPQPQDRLWDAFDNPYDQRAYERICAEFGVSPHTDWRQNLSENSGLGTPYH